MDVHALNQPLIDGEAMTNVLICHNGSSHIPHDLVHVDQDPLGVLWVESHRLYVRVDFAPLLCPVSTHLFRSMNKTALERSRPSNVRGHQGESGINVSGIKGRIGGAE